MRHPGAGTYRRDEVPKSLQRFTPHACLEGLQEVNLDELRQMGKKLILLDVDNTLMPWRTEDIPQETIAWVERARTMGFHLCILSNTRRPERLHRISEKLGIPYIRDKFKPSTRMYELAIERFEVEKKEAVMVGDQLLTDVLGANRTGIDAMWVQPIHKREFAGTRFVSRNIERVVGILLYRWFQADPGIEPKLKEGFFQRQVVRQFIKFCVVGGTSFAIDYCVTMTLMFAVPGSGGGTMSEQVGAALRESSLFGWATKNQDAFFPIAGAGGAAIAILNSFYWNRRWTFRIVGAEERGAQFRRFLIISLVGLCLNTILKTVFNSVLPFDPRTDARLATVIAAAFVALWNFLGQRLYAFRKKP